MFAGRALTLVTGVVWLGARKSRSATERDSRSAALKACAVISPSSQ